MCAVRASVFPLSGDCILSGRSMITMGMGREETGKGRKAEKSRLEKKSTFALLLC